MDDEWIPWYALYYFVVSFVAGFWSTTPFTVVCCALTNRLSSAGLPKFEPARVVHGEHELQIHAPLPAAATVTTRTHLQSVEPKKSGSIITMVAESSDALGTKVRCAFLSCLLLVVPA